jgi:competence protein ComEC
VSIIDGMILGNAYGIPQNVNEVFSALGLTHIIAISGSHIVIMISLCMWLGINFRFKRQQAFLIAIAFVVVYIILVGAPSSAVRAGIMGVIVLLAQQISRRHQPLHTLLLTAALMLVVNPKLLLWDIGFQLSFAAVFGLLVVAPVFEKWWRLLPSFLDIRTMVSMTVAAQLATLPIIIFHFKQLSPWSIVANFLILPIVPFMTIYALIHVLVAGISIWVGSIMGWGSWLLVSYWLFIASLLSYMPLVTVFFQGGWVWGGCLVSLVVLMFFVVRYRRQATSHDIL